MDNDHKWYIAVVAPNTEKACEKKCKTLFASDESVQFDTYVPTQRELHEWPSNGKRVWVDRVLCPCYLFIRCTKKTRYAFACKANFIRHFLMDRTRMSTVGGGKSDFANVPDAQMEDFMRMVGDAETPVTIDTSRLRVGSKVRVKSGCFKDMYGYLMREPNGSTQLAIRIDFLGYAKIDFPAALLELVEE